MHRAFKACLLAASQDALNGLTIALLSQAAAKAACFYSPVMQARLDELERQHKDIQTSLSREMPLSHPISRDQPQFPFSEFADGSPESAQYRRHLIDTFINSVFLTDEDIVIVYNYKNGRDRLRLDELPIALDERKTLSESSDNVNLGGA